MPVVSDIPAHNNNGKHFSTSLESVYKDVIHAPYKNSLLDENSSLYCVFYTAKGQGRAYVKGGQVFELTENVIFFGNQKTLLEITCEKDVWVFYCYWFKPLNISVPFNETIQSRFTDEEEFIDRILKGLSESDSEKSIAQTNSIFLCRLLEWLDEYNTQQQTNYTPENTLIMENIMAYIDFNLGEDLSVETLASRAGFSAKHFRTLFHAHTGITPKEYILRKRLERAKAILSSSEISLNEISKSLGFASPYHLSAQFKKRFGAAPVSYRKTKTASV